MEGVPFSVAVPMSGWSRGPIVRRPGGSFRQGNLLISKSIEGPQGAEAVIFWTTYPDDPAADPCASLVKPSGPSSAELAANVATAPGTELVTGPTALTLGGFPAEHVVLTVRDDVPGCDPGFFYTWRAECWGPCWMETNVGDTINVWIVDVLGKRLFIEAETTTQADARLEAEVQRIVGRSASRLYSRSMRGPSRPSVRAASGVPSVAFACASPEPARGRSARTRPGEPR